VDLLFLDIQMPGMAAFEMIAQVGTARMPLIIFVTGHDEFAVRAFEVQAVDYLIKPVEPGRLRTAIASARSHFEVKGTVLMQEALRAVLAEFSGSGTKGAGYPKRFLVPNGNKDSFVDIDEIEWIEASDYYVSLHVGVKTFLLRKPLKDLAQTLDPKKFVRTHRSAIVNLDKVREIHRDGRTEGFAVMASGQKVKMSQMGWKALLAASDR